MSKAGRSGLAVLMPLVIVILALVFLIVGPTALVTQPLTEPGEATFQEQARAPPFETGTFFETNISADRNVAVTSNEPLTMKLGAAMDAVDMMIESQTSPVTLSITGLLPDMTYYHYTGNFHIISQFMTDSSGSYSWSQELDGLTHVWMQTHPSTKYLNSTGGDCSSFGTWNASTLTCTMTTNLSQTVQIDSNGITLDCVGNNITGPNTYPSIGILVSGRNNTNIKNCKILKFWMDIRIEGSNFTTVSDGTFQDTRASGGYGVAMMNNANNNTVIRNNFTNNRVGIWFAYTTNNNTASGNNITFSGDGISFEYEGYNNTIRDNFIANSDSYGIFVWNYYNYNDFINNTVRNSSVCGLEFQGCGNNTAINNTLLANGQSGLCIYSSYNLISGNNASDNYDNTGFGMYGIGIILTSNSNNVTGNTAINNTYAGIKYDGGTNSNITNNNLIGNGRGILFENTNRSYMDNNTAETNTVGIMINSSSSNNTISNNTVRYNTQYGLQMRNGSSNNLTSNTVANNSQFGFLVEMSTKNRFYNNIADNNTFSGMHLQLYSDNNTFTNNLARHNDLYGIIIGNSNNSVLTNNTVSYNGGSGFRLVYSKNNTLLNNTALGNAFLGIDISYTTNSSLRGNTVAENAFYAILLSSSDYNNITDGTICHNFAALDNDTDTNVIDNNTFCVDMLYAPVNGSTISSLSSVSFNVSNPVFPSSTNCSLMVDNTAIYRMNGTVNNDNNTIALATAYATYGPHSWKIFCTDNGGSNTGNSSVNSFKVEFCGDNVCGTGESTATCQTDCPAQYIPSGGLPPPTPPPTPPPVEPTPPVTPPSPTETGTVPTATISVPPPETTLTMPPEGNTIVLEGTVTEGKMQAGAIAIIMQPVTSNSAVVHNIVPIPEPTDLAPLPEVENMQTEPITSYEIDVNADVVELCMNYADSLPPGVDESTLSVYAIKTGEWAELPSDRITQNTAKDTICARLTGTPYMIAGFAPVSVIAPPSSQPLSNAAMLTIIVLIGAALLAALGYWLLLKRVRPKFFGKK